MVKTPNIKPLFSYILLKPVEPEEKTASGIYLPENSKERPQIGEVVAVGSGGVDAEGKKVEIVVKEGQKVVYKKWGGNEIKQGTEELILVEQKDIMAIMA